MKECFRGRQLPESNALINQKTLEKKLSKLIETKCNIDDEAEKCIEETSEKLEDTHQMKKKRENERIDIYDNHKEYINTEPKDKNKKPR